MKKICFFIIIGLIICYFLIYPSSAVEASRHGLTIWFHQLLPALLPFTVLSYIVLRSNTLHAVSRAKSAGFFSIEELYIIFCGFLFGFPLGSKLTADLYGEKRISKEQAEILFVFTNNLSPVFVSTMLREQLKITNPFRHYLILYLIPLLFGLGRLYFVHKNSTHNKACSTQRKTASRFEMNMQIIDAGMIHGFETLIKLCGYIILFSIISEIIKQLPFKNNLVKLFCIGATEVTNGMSQITGLTQNPKIQYLSAILFLSWGGISGFFQTASIVSATDLSMKNYVKIRLFLVTLSVLAACLFISLDFV